MAFTAPPIIYPDLEPVVQAHVLLDDYHEEAGHPRVVTFATGRNGVRICVEDTVRVQCSIMEFTDELHALLDIDGPTRYEDRPHVLWSCLIRGIDFLMPGDEMWLLRAACVLLADYHDARASGYGFMAQQADGNAGIVERRFPNYEGNGALWEFSTRLEDAALRDRQSGEMYRQLSQCVKVTEIVELRSALKFPER